MKRLTPFLWFDSNCEEATQVYSKVFQDNFELKLLQKYPEGAGPMAGKTMMAEFRIFDEEFKAMDAGPDFKFNESISFFLGCENQTEIDYYWNALIADGGQESQCGWLKDKFGMSWQIIPNMLSSVIAGNDPEGSQRALQCMLKMQKLNIQELQDAYEGK